MTGEKSAFGRLAASAFAALSIGFVAVAEDAASVPEVVWVKADKAAFESQGVVGDGTEANPFSTIQKGIDTVAVGGTVKIMAGTYDYDEQFDGTHTNRVIINKRVILDGVDGMGKTHLVGKLVSGTAANGNIGCGSAAIRCIKISQSDANNTIIRNLTLRNSGASDVNNHQGYGGAVCGSSMNSRGSVWVVDCVVSNCAAVMGGALNGVSAVRCKFIENRSTGYGAAIRYCNAIHCLMYKNRKHDKTGVTSTRPVVAYSYAINCTLVGGSQSKTCGFGRGASVYNCISVDNSGGAIVTPPSSEAVSMYSNCYTESVPFVDLGEGDYRLVRDSPTIGGGDTKFLSLITTPDDVPVNIDLAGNEIDLTKETCDIGCYQRIFDWYVDAGNGDDGNRGNKAGAAKKTLAAIMPSTLPGDTVHAAPGTYDEGTMTTDSKRIKARVVIPTGVTLTAEKGPAETFVVGAPDATESGDEHGFGTNAVQCVFLMSGARIKGFTVTGGYTWAEIPEGFTASNNRGGGVVGADRNNTFADGCIISNNWAYYSGGGIYNTSAVRSWLFENHSMYQGGAMHSASIYGCVMDKNYTGYSTGTRPSACWQHKAIVGCTLGGNTYTHDGGSNGKVLTGEADNAIFSHNIVLGDMGVYSSSSYKLTGSVFKYGVGNWAGKLDETCIVSAGDSIKLDENYRPLPGSVGVDWITAEQLSESAGGKLPVDKDISGFQRVMNGKADCGALEADWRGEYAKLLNGSGRRITVTEATSAVITNAVGGVSSIALGDGESFGLEWWNSMPFAKRGGKVSVTGVGTLTILRNGAKFAAYDAAGTPAEFTVPVGGDEAFDFTFSFAGEGSADIYGLTAAKGSLFTIR